MLSACVGHFDDRRRWSEADAMVKQAATDPVSAAMSAIESALNLTDDDEVALASDDNASTRQLIPAKPMGATPVLKPSQLAGDAPTLLRAGPPPAIALESEPKPAIPAATPANDDRENVGAVLQAMNARPGLRGDPPKCCCGPRPRYFC